MSQLDLRYKYTSSNIYETNLIEVEEDCRTKKKQSFITAIIIQNFNLSAGITIEHLKANICDTNDEIYTNTPDWVGNRA